MSNEPVPLSPWRVKLHEVIFEADTSAGKLFDFVLIWCILLSVFMIIMESVEPINDKYGELFFWTEWVLTVLFTIEYILRIICLGKPFKYIFSFFGIVDLISILPTYIGIFVYGQGHNLVVIRALRLLRIFRLFKLVRYVDESRVLINGLRRALPKIVVFIGAVFTFIIIIATVMYMIEGSHKGSEFNSIPRCMYWAIVTLSTVGYGDLAPVTVPGQIFASMVMLCGYGVIAVPPAIVTIGMVESFRAKVDNRSCQQCGSEGHEPVAKYCYACSALLPESHDKDGE